MDIHEIRKARVGQLIAEKYGGKQVAFAEASGISADYVSRLFSDKDGKKNLGEKLARKAELKLGLPPGWFDARWDEQTVRVANWYQTLSANDRERFAAVAKIVFNGADVVLASPVDESVQEKTRLKAVKSEVGESPDQKILPPDNRVEDDRGIKPPRARHKLKPAPDYGNLAVPQFKKPGLAGRHKGHAPKGRPK